MLQLLSIIIIFISGEVRKRSRVKVLINGVLHSEWEITKPGEEIVLRVSAAANKNGDYTVEFELPDAVSPKELGLSDDVRRLSLAFKKIVTRVPSVTI